MVQKQIADAPTPLRVHREGLPAWCETILQRALAKSPADRFQTAEEFREILRKATGMVTTEPANAFAISIEDTQIVTAPAALEHFGPTHVMGALARSGKGATITIPRRPRSRLTITLAAVLASGVVMALALVALGRPGSRAPASTASPAPAVPAPATATAPSSTPETPAATPAAPAPTTATSSTPEAPAPGPATAAPAKAAPSPSATPAKGPRNTAAPPFFFEARALALDGDRQREFKSETTLDDGKITIWSNNEGELRGLLYTVPYNDVLSISYTRGRDPLWNGPDGPTVVARGGGRVFGPRTSSIVRDWLALRITKEPAQFVVLRFDDELRARRAIAALEERTGRRAQLVAEPHE